MYSTDICRTFPYRSNGHMDAHVRSFSLSPTLILALRSFHWDQNYYEHHFLIFELNWFIVIVHSLTQVCEGNVKSLILWINGKFSSTSPGKPPSVNMIYNYDDDDDCIHSSQCYNLFSFFWDDIRLVSVNIVHFSCATTATQWYHIMPLPWQWCNGSLPLL